MPCGTKPVVRAVSGSIAQAPPSEPIGTRDIDSTPPARIRSSKPERTCCGGHVDGLEAGGAEAVELHAGDGLGVAGGERRGLGDVAALVADRRDDAEHDVVDALGSSAGVAGLDLVHQADDQVDRLHLVQGADRLALAARRAEVVVDECFPGCLLWGWSHASDCDTLTVMVVKVDGAAVGTLTLLTLEELTERIGMSVRNVRFYTTKGLVPPPIRRGRSGYYSADHVARLQLVQELQGHGFTLSAIERYVARIPDDASPEDIALHRTMLAPWMADSWQECTRTELERQAGRRLTTADLDTLEALGVLRTGGRGRFRVSSSQLGVGLGLLDLGYPIEAARAAAEVYAAHGRAIAEELYELFRTRVWPVYKEQGVSPEKIQEVVERLKPLSIASLVQAYEAGMDETRRANIAKRAR